MMDVFVNGHKYILKAGTSVLRQPKTEWPQNLRLTGSRLRNDLSDLQTWAIEDLSGGFGTERIDLSSAKDNKSFWDSEVNTLWPHQKTLPPLRAVSSFNTLNINDAPSYNPHPIAPLKFMWHHDGELLGIGSTALIPTIGTSRYFIYPFKFTSGGWQNVASAILDTTVPSVSPIKIVSQSLFGGSHVLLSAVPSSGDVGYAPWYMISTPTAGIYPIGSTYGLVGTLETNMANMEAVIGYHTDGQLWVAYYSPRGRNLRVDKFTAAFARTSILNISYPTPPLGIASYFDPFDNSRIFLCFEDGLYFVDDTNGRLVPAIKLDSEISAVNGKDMRVWQGKLIVPTKRGMISYSADGTYTMIGLDQGSGLPSKKAGDHLSLDSTYDFLVQTLHAEEACAFVLHDNWHFLTRGANASQAMKPILISSEDDNTPRLHWMAGTLPYFIPYPFNNPLQITGATYATEGKLTLPQNDFGMPEYLGGFFSEFIEGNALSVNQRIQALYGFDNAAPTQQLGIATQGNTEIQFAGGVGTQAHYIQPQFNLIRGSSQGTTPVLKSAILKFLKLPEIRDQFSFTVDLEQTSQARQNLGSDKIIQEIGSLVSMKVQVPFHYGMIATRLVLVREAPIMEGVKEYSPLNEYGGERTGELTLQLLEMLPH